MGAHKQSFREILSPNKVAATENDTAVSKIVEVKAVAEATQQMKTELSGVTSKVNKRMEEIEAWRAQEVAKAKNQYAQHKQKYTNTVNELDKTYLADKQKIDSQVASEKQSRPLQRILMGIQPTAQQEQEWLKALNQKAEQSLLSAKKLYDEGIQRAEQQWGNYQTQHNSHMQNLDESKAEKLRAVKESATLEEAAIEARYNGHAKEIDSLTEATQRMANITAKANEFMKKIDVWYASELTTIKGHYAKTKQQEYTDAINKLNTTFATDKQKIDSQVASEKQSRPLQCILMGIRPTAQQEQEWLKALNQKAEQSLLSTKKAYDTAIQLVEQDWSDYQVQYDEYIQELDEEKAERIKEVEAYVKLDKAADIVMGQFVTLLEKDTGIKFTKVQKQEISYQVMLQKQYSNQPSASNAFVICAPHGRINIDGQAYVLSADSTITQPRFVRSNGSVGSNPAVEGLSKFLNSAKTVGGRIGLGLGLLLHPAELGDDDMHFTPVWIANDIPPTTAQNPETQTKLEFPIIEPGKRDGILETPQQQAMQPNILTTPKFDDTQLINGPFITPAYGNKINQNILTKNSDIKDRNLPQAGHRYFEAPDRTFEGLNRNTAIRTKSKTPVQGGGKLRDRWKDSKGLIYEWDYQEGHFEIYSKNGKTHLGAFSTDMKIIKPGDPRRRVEP